MRYLDLQWVKFFPFLILYLCSGGELVAKSQIAFAHGVAAAVERAVRKHIDSGHDVETFRQEDLMKYGLSSQFPNVGSAFFYVDRFRVVAERRLYDANGGKQVIAIATYGYKEQGSDVIWRHVIWHTSKPANDSPQFTDWEKGRGVLWSVESEEKMVQMFVNAGLTLDRLGMWEQGKTPMDRVALPTAPLAEVVFEGVRPPRAPPPEDTPVLIKLTKMVKQAQNEVLGSSPRTSRFWFIAVGSLGALVLLSWFFLVKRKK